MKVVTREYEVYEYDELREEAKKGAIEELWDVNVDHKWYDDVYADAIHAGALMGISIDKILFSGFDSQGDGACFNGYYKYREGSVKEISEYAPTDKELERMVRNLYEIQKRAEYCLTASIKHQGQYYNSRCTEIEVERNDEEMITGEQEDGVCELMRDFMNWVYKLLEEDYEYRTSRVAIEDTIKTNEWKFMKDGGMF